MNNKDNTFLMARVKTCSKCGIEKPLTVEFFYRRKDKKDGFETICKECKKEYNKKYWEENKEKLRKQKAKYYQQNKDKFAERNKAYRDKNREELIKYGRNYYKENRERLLEQKKEYYKQNREKKLKYREKYYKVNKDKLIKYARNYYKVNKENIAAYSKKYREKNRDLRNTLEQRRKAKKKKLPHNFTEQDWQYTKEYFNNKCAYCGSNGELTQEHFIPLSKGGEYTINNIIPACRSCNCSKKDRDFFEWYPEQSFYSKARENKILEYLNYIDSDIQQLALL